jgi:hypothetical protein
MWLVGDILCTQKMLLEVISWSMPSPISCVWSSLVHVQQSSLILSPAQTHQHHCWYDKAEAGYCSYGAASSK